LRGQNAGVLMRGWWMKGMFALLARAGTMARFPCSLLRPWANARPTPGGMKSVGTREPRRKRAPLAESSMEEGPYAGWEVFMVGPMVGLDRKVPSPGEQLPNG
jgi:hypothetical protein